MIKSKIGFADKEVVMSQYFAAAGLMLSWVLAPELLVMVNGGSGASGLFMLAALGAGFVLAALSAFLMHHPQLFLMGYQSDLSLLQRTYGRVAAATLLLAGRIPLLLFVSTGTLVTAGYAFNEIFLYWFPNFLFASLLLFLITFVNLFDERHAMRAQAIAAVSAIAGMLLLIFLGADGTVHQQASVAGLGEGMTWSLLALGFISFLGFDFHRANGSNMVVFAVLAGCFLLLSLWVIVAVKTVGSESLAESTVAYMMLARAVGGETGRYIMGIALICGVFCGVNGLFIVCRRAFADLLGMFEQGTGRRRRWLVVLLFAVIIETMMLSGVAGENVLQIQIQAALVVWLLYLAGRTVSAGGVLQSAGHSVGFLGYPTGAAILAVMAVCALLDGHFLYILTFSLLVLAGAMLLSVVWGKMFCKERSTI